MRHLQRTESVAILLLTTLLAGGRLEAQASTGKIEGGVHAPDGGPLEAAQVYIVGTAYFAQSDPRGHYFIKNVPAGTITIRVALIGHRPLEVRNLRVLAGQTITQDFLLQPAPVQLQELTSLVAANPLVPRDEVTSKQRVSGEFTDDLPVDRLRGVLTLQPGVIGGVDNGVERQSLSIRGGRPDEVVTYIDGVPVTPGYREGDPAGTEISVATNGVEEASITTGAPSAEFGNALSGVISIQTRTGDRLAGSLAYETDEPFGVNHSLGFNRVQAQLSGPVARNLSFFFSGALEGRQSQGAGFDAEKAPIFVLAGLDTTVAVPKERGNPVADTTQVPVYRLAVSRGNCEEFARSANEGIRTNYGLPCQGIRTPSSATSKYEVQGKLNYTYGLGSRIALSYLGNQNQGRLFDYANLYNVATQGGYRLWSNILSASWIPKLQRSVERELALETYFSYQEDHSTESPLSLEGERATRHPFGGFMLAPLDLLFDFDNFPIDAELVQNLREHNSSSRLGPYNQEGVAQYNLIDQFNNDAYALPGWSESGGPVGTLRLLRERRYVAKANLDWQIDRYNRIRSGGEFTRHSIDRYVADLMASSFGDAYLEKPIRWNLFLEDRLDLGDVVLVGGLRFDAYDTRASRDLLLDTVGVSPTFGEYLPVGEAALYGTDGSTFDCHGARPCGMPLVTTQRDRGHGYLSPHIQVSFPVTARTNLRLSYAHQVQTPDFALVLSGVNFGGVGTDLDFGKTILFEFGIRHAFSDDMVLDLAAYNKDNLAVAAARTLLMTNPFTGSRSGKTKFTNADYGNTRGMDLRLDRRIGNLFNGTVSYSYQSAKSTGSDPFSNQTAGIVAIQQIGGAIGPPPQAILPTGFSRPHTLAGAVSVTFPSDWKRGTLPGTLFRNLGLFAVFRYTSGTPYTVCSAAAGNEAVFSDGGCSQGSGAINGARLPAYRQFDLRLTKEFGLGPTGITAYLDLRNLFNFANTLKVFSTTGDLVNSVDRQNRWSTDSADYAAAGDASGVYQGDGSLDLRFGGLVASGCAGWVSGAEAPAAPNCVYLIRAEERYGDGNHMFTLDEQRRASDALYAAVGRTSSFFARGRHNLTGDPRRVRVGLEVSF
ncbi:MAG TPA: TonB-dependent receptor [Gemmatimonadales bacterium]|nr:TonB-dependent receptor [Gemmatimonadales bacterium]